MENSLVPREPLCKPTWRVLADTHSASRRSRSGLAHGGLRGAPLKRGPRVCSECGDGAFCTRLPKATRRLNPASPQITEGGSSSSQEMVRDSVEPASGPALDAPLGEAEGEGPRSPPDGQRLAVRLFQPRPGGRERWARVAVPPGGVRPDSGSWILRRGADTLSARGPHRWSPRPTLRPCPATWVGQPGPLPRGPG